MSRLILWLLIVGAVIAAVAYYPPLRLSAIVLAGRSPDCPYDKAIKSEENLRAQIALKDRILEASKLVEKDPKGFRHYSTPMGDYWVPEGSEYVLPFNLAEQERNIYGTGEHFVQPGDVVLDCGANVGAFTRQALDAGAKLVVAIEPAPENLECLRRNFTAEAEKGKVIIYPKGVWDKDDMLELSVDHHNSAADSFVIRREGAEEHGQKLPLTTIDKLVAELKLEKVDFIKMDIEGAEPRALKGARATLQRFHPRLSVSVYHAPDHPESVPREVLAAWPGYQVECGPCAEADTRIRPDILYFR